MIVLDDPCEAAIRAFLEEIESLIDADDGTVFQLQHIDAVDEIKERLNTAKEEHNSTFYRVAF